MVKIAVCYWGIPRSIREVMPSQLEHVFHPLRLAGIQYDIYAHFWKTDVNRVWDWVVPVPLDYDSISLLNAKQVVIEDQQPFVDRLLISDYYYEHERKEDAEKEWCPILLRNHLCALESQKRCMNLCISANVAYDYVLFLRPDALIQSPLLVHNIFYGQMAHNSIVLPTNNHYEGLNDRFAVVRFEHAMWYSHRINRIREFRQKHGRIVAEKYVKHIVDEYFQPIFLDFYFRLLRSDGSIM